jgi:hypothetical protein
LVYHTFDKEGSDGFTRGKDYLEEFLSGGMTSVKQILQACSNSEKFHWGEGDGN